MGYFRSRGYFAESFVAAVFHRSLAMLLGLPVIFLPHKAGHDTRYASPLLSYEDVSFVCFHTKPVTVKQFRLPAPADALRRIGRTDLLEAGLGVSSPEPGLIFPIRASWHFAGAILLAAQVRSSIMIPLAPPHRPASLPGSLKGRQDLLHPQLPFSYF